MYRKLKTLKQLQNVSNRNILSSNQDFNTKIERLIRTNNFNRKKAIRFYVKNKVIDKNTQGNFNYE